MADNQGPSQEVYNNVLAITRDQLAKAMNLNAELEAMLLVERKKTADLETKLSSLEAADKDKK